MDNDNKYEMQQKMLEKKKEVKTVRKIVSIIAGVALLIFLIVGISGYVYISSALKPVDENAKKEISVEVPLGSGISNISKILEDKDIIKNATVFKYYAKFQNESSFQAGNYTFTQAMTLDEILQTLKTGKLYREPIFSITVPEGLTLEQIADVIAKNTPHSAKDVMAKLTDKTFIELMMAEFPELLTEEIFAKDIRYALEGYLYPATYPYFEKNPTIEEVIQPMIKSMDDIVLSYREAISESGMSVHEFLTFASLLEEEATATTDRETIASVFYNRIEVEMPLQTDPTVLYSLGGHKDRVLFEDLEVENPYNTYKVKGLPPGPIAGAGKTSLE
ncbi:MAG: endolytic transglycosylase MltG, partial [Lysinibacillus sp.]